MSITLFLVLALGFLLGIRHAMEPDHVIAVSTIASQSKKIWHASLAGIFWGIGHTLSSSSSESCSLFGNMKYRISGPCHWNFWSASCWSI